MTSHTPHPLPRRVLAIDDGSRRSQTITTIATGVAARFGIPTQVLTASWDPDPRTPGDTDPPTTAALIVTNANPRRPSRTALDHPQLAARDRMPWIAIGPALRSAHCDGPDQLTVAVDGTAETDALVPTALAWASAFGLGVHLVAVLPDAPPPLRQPEHPTQRQQFYADPETHLHALLADLPPEVSRVKTDVLRDPIGVASALHRYLRHQPETVLVAPEVRPRRPRTLIDNNSIRAILRHSPVPVLATPPPPAPHG